MRTINVTVNGTERQATVDDRLLLVDWLREELGLTGAKVGCATGACGSCTVHIDGRAQRSCLMLAAAADGRTVRTIEDVSADDGAMHVLQEALWQHHGLQCGFCTPGVVMTTLPLVEAGQPIEPATARAAIAGNICRCTGYAAIVEAVTEATNQVAARLQETS
jgi:carbon-monoxide dehydrogenase small subunit